MLERILSKIDRRLEALDLAESKAATEAGLSDSAIRNIRRAVKEGKHQGVSVLTIMALAPVLKTTPEWLISDAGPHDADQPDWRVLLQRAVLAARSAGAGPEDIRAEIVRIAPLPGIEVVLDPSMTEAQEKMLRDLSETSAARSGNHKSESK